MRIGEVAQQAGIPASTLRYYEDIGLIEAPPRRGGRREYDESIFRVLRLISWAKKAGFSLAEIHQTLQSPSWRDIAQRKLVQVEETIQHYQAMRQRLQKGLACTCTGVHDCPVLA